MSAMSTPPLPPRAPQVAMLPGGRLHLQDGPIDLIIGADGPIAHVQRAYDEAIMRFTGLLPTLCEELPALRAAASADLCQVRRLVARSMWNAVRPHARDGFITPMAAVAGAVADHILEALARPGIRRAFVNNGGDIAIHLEAGEAFTVGLVDRPDRPSLTGTARIHADSPVRGIATSGWRGRSFSLGIADAVTILAPTAAMADAAATVVANAVDLPEHLLVVREPACDLQPDSDLGSRRVTRHVPRLSDAEKAQALDAGLACAQDLIRRGLICAAALHLQGETLSAGDLLTSADAALIAPVSTPHRQEGRLHA